MLFNRHKQELPTPAQALKGHPEPWFTLPEKNVVLGTPLVTDETNIPDGFEVALFGLGCFWGAEEIYWRLPGVWSTSVGYAGGVTPYPSYEEVCSGLTGHTEAVLVVFDPSVVSYERLVATFFEVHDPTQGMRQGNDIGTQYRSAIYYGDDAPRAIAEQAKAVFSETLRDLGFEPATTEIAPAGEFYYAEDYHQQYLAKNPNGYRCHSTTGVRFPLEKLGATT